MANTKKYVSLAKLGVYHEKEVARVAAVVAAAKSEATAYADSLASNYDAVGSAAAVQAKLDEEVTRAKAAEEAAAAAAKKAQDEVDALETYVGTIPEGASSTNVVAYVQEKTAGIATSENLQELTNRVSQAETDIDNIEKDYLKAADKTELSNAIAAEKSRAEGIEGGLETRLAAVEGDYLKAADKTELQGNIDTVSEGLAAVKEDVDFFFKDALKDEANVQKYKDTLKEIQDYMDSDANAATEMTASIKQNADDIDAVEGRVGTLEGEMDTVEGKVSTIEGNIASLQGEDTAIKGRLDALEGAIGESGSVADDIATAKQEAIDAAAGDATSKANAAEGNAKTYADGLNTAMDTRVSAVEGKAHEHGNKTVLDGITSEKVAGWDNAVSKIHEHANKAVLDGITEAKVTAWDAAEQNAKTYADGLNTAMASRVSTLETWHSDFVEASEEEINALFA